MPVEIERKFLVHQEMWNNENPKEHKQIRQGYLLSQPDKTIRVRVAGEKGFITIKGKAEGAGRPEYEYEIPLNEAHELIDRFADRVIEKIRYYIHYKNKLWEVDKFEGDNAGLMIAEIELNDADESFEKPAWAGEEVTEDPKYLNVHLAQKPYSQW